ncbi:hypothetical protein WICMUC_001431 [Wickerhamomyces mucosus]|uniref:54S ribosomal protein L31, mitochondrial n=1 Tax=Wickerhamomyces mucosus TaxID=1378264 RepID=A0A9P8PW12_9ASCO|nr:hypothetical protein WICMUC_001431 [Wickerhamomyces mucosus]
MSQHQKYRHRKRLIAVDDLIKTVFSGLNKTSKPHEFQNLIDKYSRFPKESEMKAKDKYTVFNKNEKGYRKSVHRTPKWTKVSRRVNPEYF